jgi:dephospho-CoA kinase
MALQMPESKKKKLAHAIIENNGNLSELHEKLGIFWKSLNVG